MKRLRRLLISLMITALMAAGMPMTAFAKPDWPSDTGIESEAGIVMDADSGAVLFGQNIHVQKAPASITKILTALVVIENSSLDDTITFSTMLFTTWKMAAETRTPSRRATRFRCAIVSTCC